MPIRVSPRSANPTHHISLTDRSGKTVGLILCDDKGQPISDPRGQFNKNPVDTTAQKQTSGSSSYNDYAYPYSPIVQDDLSGGRASLDFERDATKFYDSFRTRSGRANKAFAGPQETYARSESQVAFGATENMPGSVKWHQLVGAQKRLYKRFRGVQSGLTSGLEYVWLLARRKGKPSDLTIAFYEDSSGTVGNLITQITVPYTRLADLTSEWMNEAITLFVNPNPSYTWLVVSANSGDNASNHWKIGVKDSPGTTYYSDAFDTTPTAATVDMYYHVTSPKMEYTCIPFDYKEQKYFVASPNAPTGSPAIFMMGDRGSADSNASNLSKLFDATKSWGTNMYTGDVVKIIDGPGANEERPWRTIVSNTGNELVLDEAWTIEHTTSTEYVIYSTQLTSVGGHGMVFPVTDVLVTTRGIILFALGDSVNIRRAKFETSAGVWTATYADDGTNKATFLDYMPQAQQIVKANQRDGSSNTSIAKAPPVDWATASHTFAAAVPIDSKYIRITGTAVYPDGGGIEALYVFKEDIPFIVPSTGNPYPLTLEEMKSVRSPYNGRNPLVHNVYLYFPMGYGLEKYYSGSIDDMGPNLGEGLPDNRRGNVTAMAGYPGKLLIAIDGGADGYSSILDSGGWHERYRAPKGERIYAMSFQVIPGGTPDRLWIFQGNEFVCIPFPSDTTNELEDANYTYTPEFAVTLSRMHAGLFDVLKLVKKLKLQTESLEVNEITGEPICWFELDYRLNDDEEWSTIEENFTTSPTQELDFTNQFGLAGKRMQFRFRGYSTDNSKTPVFLAIIVNAVLRTDVKYIYGPITFRAMDGEETLTPGLTDPIKKAMNKLQQVEDWSDASTDSMLLMRSVSSLFDDKMVFMNVPSSSQILFKDAAGNEFSKDVFICTVSFQEA